MVGDILSAFLDHWGWLWFILGFTGWVVFEVGRNE